jgi:hypothetical protein
MSVCSRSLQRMWMWPPRLAGDFAGAHVRDGLGGPGVCPGLFLPCLCLLLASGTHTVGPKKPRNLIFAGATLTWKTSLCSRSLQRMWMWSPRLAGDFAGAHGRDGLGVGMQTGRFATGHPAFARPARSVAGVRGGPHTTACFSLRVRRPA